MSKAPFNQLRHRPLLWICLGALVLGGCFSFAGKIKQDSQVFEETNPEGSKVLNTGGHSLHYEVTGPEGKPLILFIHGSPGSWDAFAGYLLDKDLNSEARMASVDRPGYGGSEPGIPVASLEEQAKRIAAVIVTEGGGRPAIVLGHSLGGPVSARLAMDHPELVKALILVAPSIDPAMEVTTWYQKVAHWGWVSWMLPSAIDVCNREIMPLKGELEKMLPLWKQLKMPVTVIQGLADDMVPPENADFAQKMLTGGNLKVIRIPGLNHFVPWKRPDLLKAALLEDLKR